MTLDYLLEEPEKTIIELLSQIKSQNALIEHLIRGLVPSDYKNASVMATITDEDILRVFAIKPDGSEIVWRDMDNEEEVIWKGVEVNGIK